MKEKEERAKMIILIDSMPQSSSECLFKRYYSEKGNHWNCGFHDMTVCSLDSGMKCKYLKGIEFNESGPKLSEDHYRRDKMSKTIAEFVIKKWMEENGFVMSEFSVEMNGNIGVITDKTGATMKVEYSPKTKEVSEVNYCPSRNRGRGRKR